MVTFQVGSLVLPDEVVDGGFWFEELTGWNSVPGSKAILESRPKAHGTFDGGFDWRDGAAIGLVGHFAGETREQCLAAMDQVAALGAGNKVTATRTDELGVRTRQVSIRFIDIPDDQDYMEFTFSIDMFANDPLRYGVQVSQSTGLPVSGGGLIWPITWPITWDVGGSDGRVTIENLGTAATFPLLEVSGQLDSGFTIDEVGSGRQVRFERLVPLGSTVFLNPRTGRAYLDAPGNDVSGFLTRAEWPSVAAGASSVLQFNSLGTSSGVPTFTARLAPAFW